MNVRELQKHLDHFPENAQVLIRTPLKLLVDEVALVVEPETGEKQVILASEDLDAANYATKIERGHEEREPPYRPPDDPQWEMEVVGDYIPLDSHDLEIESARLGVQGEEGTVKITHKPSGISSLKSGPRSELQLRDECLTDIREQMRNRK